MTARRASFAGLVVLLAVAAYFSLQMHRTGHHRGDDFALYINQARSLFEGDIARVIDDNRFLWTYSVGVTPQMYPWGFPVLLSPFVRFFGTTAYAELKVVEVVVYCVWLVLLHGIVRRRLGRGVALAFTAVFATAPLYLLHTDQLLTEIPHLAAVAVAIWAIDRVIVNGSLLTASTRDLIVVGLVICLAFNFRRESLALIPALAAVHVVDLVTARRAAGGTLSTWSRGVDWGRAALPYVAFGLAAFAFQVMLPSTLVPDNGNSWGNIFERVFVDYPSDLTDQLGLGERRLLGRLLLVAAGGGAVVSIARYGRRFVLLVALAVATLALIGTHPRPISRYYFQVTWLLALFVVGGVCSLVASLRAADRPINVRRLTTAALAAPLLVVAIGHTGELRDKVDAAQSFNDRGSIQPGGVTPSTAEAFDAVLAYTDIDDVIVYQKSRTLTLYTDRRSIQTRLISKTARYADYFLQDRRPNKTQPTATEAELTARGWVIVWESEYWRLWRVIEVADLPSGATSTPGGAG